MLKLTNISAKYDVQNDYVYAVDNVNLEIPNNEILGLAGESGCGKTTLMKLMYDMVDFPLIRTSGEVELTYRTDDGHSTRRSGEISRVWWKEIAYVPQGAMHVFNPVKKIKTQFYDVIPDFRKTSRKKIDRKLEIYLSQLNLEPSVLNAYPHQLSGGMKQRLLIALATFLEPAVILADEPTTALDVVVQRQILTMLRRVQSQYENTIVIVTHDLGVHYQITDRLAVMYAGQLVEVGPTERLFSGGAAHPYTQMLVDSLPKLGDVSAREGIVGRPPDLRQPPAGCRFADRCPHVMDICKKIDPKYIDMAENHNAKCHLLYEDEAKHV